MAVAAAAKKSLPASRTKAADAAGEASDSDLSDAQAERCAVCLNRFLGQEMGTPESCDHVFCLDCIQEWAKNMNTCPVDRSVFGLILVRKGDRVVHQISVPAPGDGEQVEEEEDLTYCEVCGRCDREDRLLLCDACDLGYHCECLSPPLDSVPIEEWYCPDCAPDHAPVEDEPLPDDVMEEFREMLASRFRPGQAGGLRRAIARTRASETVRIRIQRRREETMSSPEHRPQSSSASTKRTPAKRSAPKRRRKTSSRKTTSSRKRRSTGHRRKRKTKSKGGSTKRRKTATTSSRSRKTHRKGSKRKSSRRTTRRSRLSSRPLACPPSVRQRIADRLGLARPPPGQSLPLMRRVDLGSSSSTYARGSSHGLSFSLFGDRDELVSLDGSCGEDSGNELMVARPRLPRQSVSQVKKVIARPASSSLSRVRAALSKVSPPPACGDLLGSILEMQSVFHSKGGLSGAVVQRDGSLDLRAVPSTVRSCPRSPPGSPPAESPASPPPSSRGSHSTTTAPARRASGAGGYTASDYVGSSGDNGAPGRHNDDHAQREGCGSYHHVMVPSPDTYARKNGRERAKNGPVEEDDDIDIYSDIDDGDESGDGGGMNHNGDDEPSVNGESPMRLVAASGSRDDVPLHVPSRAVDHEEEGASSSENELVIDEQENIGDAPEDEEDVDEQSRAAEESEEEGPILETDNVRSPSPDNDRDVSQASDEDGGLEIVENGNSSDGEQGEDENNESKEGDEGEDEAGDGGEQEEDKTEGQPFADEDESPQQEPEEEEAGLAAVEDTPASPTEDTSFVPDAPVSPPVDDAPSSPVDEAPSPPPADAPASPMEDAVPAASPIESGEESSDTASPVREAADDQVPERGDGDGEDGQGSEGKAAATDVNEGEEDDMLDNASSPKEIESPEEEEGEEQEEGSLVCGGPAGEDIASPAPEEAKELDDGGVRNLLDSIGAEDITSPEEEEEEEEGALRDTEDEEGLIEDASNGMEDISEPGSTDGLVDNLEDIVREQEPWRREQAKEKPARKDRKSKHKKESCHHRKHRRHRRNTSSNEDREEGEIVEEHSPSSSSRRRKEAEALMNDTIELPPRINISELPRIPKLKRGSDKVASHVTSSEAGIGAMSEDTCMAATSHVEVKRTSVLGRVDSGSEISWKKLSKHSRERSYRDGKQRDDTVLFKEREIKKREKAESRIERSENMVRKDSEARASSHSPPPPKKKERRPDRELYVRPDKKRDWHKKDKEKEKSSRKENKSSSSSSSHKDRKDKYKEKDKHSGTGSSKEHGRHSSKDRRRSSSKERREHRHSGRHRRDHSEDRSAEKFSKQKESRRADERESRRYDDRDSRESREKRDSRETRSSRETRESRDEGSRARESRDTRESRDARESRDTRESRDARESRDSRESKDTREARESTRDSREVIREVREPRRTEEKIKVVVDKDYWHDKSEHKEHSPSPLLEDADEHTPIESKEVIAKGDSIIINVNFNRSKKEPKIAPVPLTEPDAHHKSSARESRSRKREASSPVTPQYGSDSGDESLVTKKRRRHHRLGRDSGRDESEASEPDDEDDIERSPAYDFDDRASASSPSGSDNFADKPSTPPEVQDSPPSPATADKSPTLSQATPPVPEPSPPLLPQPPISSSSAAIQLSPQSPPPPSPPSPPEDNSYDPCEPTKSPSPPPPMATSEVDPCPPPEPELPPLPPEPEPPSRTTVASAASLPQTATLPSVVAPVTGPAVLPAVTGLQLQPPPPFLPARPLTTVVGSLAGAWAPAAGPVILGLRAPFVPPALGALLAPPMGMMPLRPPPPPIVRLATPTIVAAPAATAPTTLSTLPPEPAARAVEQTGVVDMDVSTPPLYSPTDVPSSPPEPAAAVQQQLAAVVQRGSSTFDTLLPAADRKASGRSSKSKRHASSGASSRDSKQVVHFVMEKSKGSSSNVTRSRSESKFGRSMDESQLQILDELPSSAVEMQVKDKFLKKLNRQERVVEEVKLSLKPYYNRREISKEEYKDILRKSVPKICHNKKGEINPMKIKAFVEGYVRKIKHSRKKLSSEQRHKAS
ncbi:uncharacterized protein LOC144128124 isoform X2 [Amblyomma americanum]